MPRLEEIARALAAHEPKRLPPPRIIRDHAAVALVLAGDPQALSLCFILRASHPGSRWSGQMAFPGGRGEPDDPHPRAVAERETREEVGLDLGDAQHLGALADISMRRRGGPDHGVVSPFVFYLGDRTPPLRPNYEVAEAWWVPLHHLWDAGNRGAISWKRENGEEASYPGIRYNGEIIWGLTYRILFSFADVLGRPLPGQDDVGPRDA